MSDTGESTPERSLEERPRLTDEVSVHPSRVSVPDSLSVVQRVHTSSGVPPGFDELVRAAEATVRVYTPTEAIDLAGEPGIRFVDVRDAVELSDGMISEAIHASRGRLEAHLDSTNPRYIGELDDATEVVFYCASGGRSALAAQRTQELGFDRVGHLAGGISAWKEADGPIQIPKDRR